jgi:hypothetical protein
MGVKVKVKVKIGGMVFCACWINGDRCISLIYITQLQIKSASASIFVHVQYLYCLLRSWVVW